MKRTQIMLETEQYDRLNYLASRTHKSIAELIRDAIDKVYKKIDVKNKTDIVKRMASMNLPVSSWEKIEKELESRHSE